MKAARSPYIIAIIIVNIITLAVIWGIMYGQNFLNPSLVGSFTGVSLCLASAYFLLLWLTAQQDLLDDFKRLLSISNLFTLIGFIIPTGFLIAHHFQGLEYQVATLVLIISVAGISLPFTRLLSLLFVIVGASIWIVFNINSELTPTAVAITMMSLSYTLLISHPAFQSKGKISRWIEDNFSLHFTHSMELLKTVFIAGFLVYAIQINEEPMDRSYETYHTKAPTFTMEGSWKMRHIGYYNISLIDEHLYPLLKQYERIDTLYINSDDQGFISFADSEEKVPCHIDTANHIIEVPSLAGGTSRYIEISYEISSTGEMIMRHENEDITLIFSK